MRVSTIKKYKIQNLILPDEVTGTYWIDGTDSSGIKRNLISIEADHGKWKLMSNKEVYCLVDDYRQVSTFLEEGRFYNVVNDVTKETFILYCSPVIADYKCFDIEESLSKGISIGSKNGSFITYNMIDNETCYIQRYENKIYVIDNKSKCGVYVNDVRVIGRRELKVGDKIFIAGLKIILSVVTTNRTSHCIYVNSGTLQNVSVKAMTVNQIAPQTDEFQELEQEVEFPLYDESAYFHKMPRFFQRNKTLELEIDSPPEKIESHETSLLLTIGPMITMSMTSLVSCFTTLSSISQGTTTMKQAFPSLLICFAMFASVFVWPMFSKWYERLNRMRKENDRQIRYSQYIERKRMQIVEAKTNQTAILNNNYMKTKEAADVILGRYTTLWQRRVTDEDFLEVNLGLGSYKMLIDIKYPEDRFTMVDDNLKNMVSKLGQEPKMLQNVPVICSLRKNIITGIIGTPEKEEYAKQLLIQILALHSYDNLKIVVLTDEDMEYNWKFLRQVPHCFTDDKSLRFFATNNDEYKEVCYYLEKVFESRKEELGTTAPTETGFKENFLIVTDSFKKIRNFDIIERILENNNYYGFSMLILEAKLTNLPDQCSTFIEITPQSGNLRKTETINDPIQFGTEFDLPIDYDACAKSLANIPIEISSNDENQIANRLGFLEMYDVGKVEQLNCLIRWQKNNPILNLQVPVGVGKNGDKISIDLHEKYHGPHGLIAGMTGSGKSEFIITYILSMAINYHPYEVQFILIDYKGGGLAGAFENKSTGLKLPHLVGTITNLDANEIKRSLASIESELKRRQALFNRAREISGESTIDIYKYQKMFREKTIDEPVSHLFIICDEFAELKNQEPEFMDQLISTARIGRSLGVHLILATQKPSGVVDPQIWSNTRFRVCMRVQDKSDSNEVIKCPDAAYLKNTGRFYFQVGYNEVFVLGQAAYAGGKYIPTESVTKTLDTMIDFIDNIGYTIKKVDTKPKVKAITADIGEELTNLLKYMDNIAKEENIKCKPLWLEKISPDLRIEELGVKYNYQKTPFVINPIIGEYDIPTRQEQRLLTIPLSTNGNALVYGASGSGKENFVSTLIYSSSLYYTPEEVNYYVIDFGTESLKMFMGYPIVGDILTSNDDEKIKNLYKMLNATIEERRNLFQQYNGDYMSYSRNSGKTVPNIVVVINNFESYQETYGDLDESLVILTRECNKYGIYFVITLNTPNGLRFKLKQNFALSYVLQQNNDDDYTTILGNIRKNYPAKIYGRGLIRIDDVYEFQTASICDKDNRGHFVKEKLPEFTAKCRTKAKPIPTLPEIVTYQEIAMEFGKSQELIVGINKNNLKVAKFDFVKNYATVITSLDLVSSNSFINPFINQIIARNDTSLIVINADDYYIDDTYKTQYQYVNDQFNSIFDSLSSFLKVQNANYIKNNYSKTIFENKKKITCIIIGVDSFKNRLSDSQKLKFAELFNNGKDLGIINFILVDSIDKIKKIEVEPWYKNCVNSNAGIWFGNGINDQFSLKITQKIPELKEEIPDNFCFVIKRGKPEYVKYVERFDIKINKN